MRRMFIVWFSFLIIISMLLTNMGSFENTTGTELQNILNAPSPPIRIDNNAQFSIHASSGDGNPGTPWVIENLEIEGNGAGSCLYIGNTTDHFIITHCTLSNASGGSGLPYFSNTGLTLYNVQNANITNNTIDQNTGNGIYLNSTSWSNFTLNDMTQNAYGLRSDNASHNNTIYRNNFLSNSVQAFDDGANTWNLTAPGGGNHWSDWTTPDNDLDGFVDNRYVIPGTGGDGGDIPAGYYDPVAGLGGIELKDALHIIIRGHTELTYDDLWTVLMETDEDPNNSDNFILIYTGRSLPKTAVYPDWNREHVWAKSHGDFDTNPPAGTDAHHLRPCDVSVNSDRGNLDFDNGGVQNPEATECYSDSDSWEPRDAVKGDIARMMFYMATRYDGDPADHGGLDLELVDYVPTSGSIFGKLSTLLEWHINDPVDDIDIHRNEIVYSNQNNRNPFIDHPEYVDAIWGSGDPPAAGSGVGTNRDYLPFAIQEGWNAPPGPVHNIDKGTDHHMIQWAIDNATSGDRIIVDDKTYFENLVIDKALDIRASAMNAVIDGGNTGHVIEIIADNVVLEGFKVQNSGLSPGDSGIRLNGFDHCSILDNNITGTDTAISLMSSSDNNTIINNTFIGNEMGVNSLGSWNDIYHNNFIANTVHVEDSGYNEWDMGFPIGGNFWDNWTTPDADMDGFVDDPFIITTGSGGGTPLDLGGYRIEQYGSSLTWTFTAGDLVQPEGYIVIGRLADKASFESFWGVTLGADVLYIDANNVAGSTFLVINGGETFELFDDISISIDGPTGYTMVSGNSAQRTATTDEGTLVGSWNIVSRDLATPGSGASGDTSAGLVVNEYSDAASYQYEFIELYYDSPISGGAGSNNQDNWPFTIQDDWLTSTISNHTIILEEGWNLISTPFANADPSIDSVLADINGKWDYILAYDASEPSNHWKSNATFKPQQLNDLLSLDHEMGFWINITEAGASLFLEGYEVQTTIQLRAGWNLIGYPTLNNNTTIAEALAGTGYTMVEGFNATAPYHVEVLADNYVMKPGEGYWVHVPADTGWVVDW